MSRLGADQVKRIVIDPKRQTGEGNTWTVERWGGRYAFIGPDPGTMLFTSVGARSWSSAIGEARQQWDDMDRITRDKWYGPDGHYAKMARESA